MEIYGRKRSSGTWDYPGYNKRQCIIPPNNTGNFVDPSRDARKRFLDEINEQITLDKKDKTDSKALVNRVLRDMLQTVCNDNGGQIYKQLYVDAGSYPIKAKIGKADEFDVNIPMAIDPVNVRLSGQVRYAYVDTNPFVLLYRGLWHGQVRNPNTKASQMENKSRVQTTAGCTIPRGYAVLEVRDNTPQNGFGIERRMGTLLYARTPPSFLTYNTVYDKVSGATAKRIEIPSSASPMDVYRRLNTSALPQGFQQERLANCRIPDKFRHGRDFRGLSLMSSNPINSSQTGNIDLIPFDVKTDLYEKLSWANYRKDVKISKAMHGPAITFQILPGRNSQVKHNISVDVTASVSCTIPLKHFGWPRQASSEAFGTQLVAATIQTGCHLVPKKDLFWAVSFSKAERTLLSGVDRDNGCRKYVYKILKKYVRTCQSRSRSGLPGISSHIIKTQVLWSCENHAKVPHYWQQNNRDVCVMNTMRELELTLLSGSQLDYFNTSIDILEGKDTAVLKELATFLQSEYSKLNLL